MAVASVTATAIQIVVTVNVAMLPPFAGQETCPDSGATPLGFFSSGLRVFSQSRMQHLRFGRCGIEVGGGFRSGRARRLLVSLGLGVCSLGAGSPGVGLTQICE